MVNKQFITTQKSIAVALGVSQARVSILKKKGMPLDSVASAKAWRESRSAPMVNGQNQPTQKELAAAMDMTRANVTRLKKQGMPVDSVAAAQSWRESRQNVAARKPAPPGLTLAPAIDSAPIYPPKSFDAARMPEYRDMPDEDHQAARTRREIAEANLAEMREAEERGKLIQVSAIRAAWAGRIVSTRDALLQIPPRLAPVLAAESDLTRVTQLLEDEIRQALAELSREGSARRDTEGTAP